MPFKSLLTQLVEAVPGANGAILADWEGEAVEQHTYGDPFEMKVTAAHWGILITRLKELQEKFRTGTLHEVLITTDDHHVVAGTVGEDYALVLTLDLNALPLLALHKFRETARLLKKEIY